jgi:hypothetical protein
MGKIRTRHLPMGAWLVGLPSYLFFKQIEGREWIMPTWLILTLLIPCIEWWIRYVKEANSDE